jgi:acyl-CoA synthetase (AMP-forming)/AMP-acid ligase II
MAKMVNLAGKRLIAVSPDHAETAIRLRELCPSFERIIVLDSEEEPFDPTELSDDRGVHLYSAILSLHETPAPWGGFDTGDLAKIDDSGNLTITGRAKDLIKSGGEWINPAEIEKVVGDLPGIDLVAVVGISHPKWGERPVLVIKDKPFNTIGDEAIIKAIEGVVPRWWIPETIFHTEEFPIAQTGKIDKRALRAMFNL